MDEHDWLACEDPDRMLKFLGKKYSPRKLRLFAVACCRCQEVWHTLGNAGQRAVEMAERYADGQARQIEVDEAGEAASLAYLGGQPGSHAPGFWVTRWNAFKAACDTSAYAAAEGIGTVENLKAWEFSFAAARAKHCDLLRDIAGNPFRSATLASVVLTWQDGTVVRIAQSIYESNRFGDLPILADALEDAGCSDADILNHCRGEGEHVRGCWVIDLLTGRP
jgi:hypothetical protein